VTTHTTGQLSAPPAVAAAPPEDRSAEAFWSRIRPVLPRVGVTRVADVTWLDDIGIPCCQAIRPDARTVSVSQGKGRTRMLAAISAAMEAIEVWHAENLPGGTVTALGEVAPDLGYPLHGLRMRSRPFLNPATPLEWTPARRLSDNAETLVPTASLRLDSVVEPVWDPVHFEVSSNGLASGATVPDATLHGLYEVIERDAMAHGSRPARRLVPAGLPEVVSDLLARFSRAQVDVTISLVESRSRVPCFVTDIRSEDFPIPFRGSAAHLDAATALCRALVEAAQSRIAAISGTRDDLVGGLFTGAYGSVGAPVPGWPAVGGGAAIGWDDVPSLPTAGAGADVAELTRRLVGATGHSPLLVEHTRADLGIPVVRVVAPTLRCPDTY
jgi:YcaO-like protein with predicted kinase domain